MPGLDWQTFEQLPGAQYDNFEKLCRAAIRRNYGRYGDFAALANQPGVEFHLKLEAACALGDRGRWYGWQCRWYDLPAGRALGNARRRKIKEAIATTEGHLTGLTDWVLWTRRPLTKGDEAWFKKLKTPMRLHQWTADEVESELTGDAEILRATYFGELVLTPEGLAELHKRSVAPILPRWQPAVHQTVDAERLLRRMLGETTAWDHLGGLARQLKADASSVRADRSTAPDFLRKVADDIAEVCLTMAGALGEVQTAVARGDLDLLRQEISTCPAPLHPEAAALPRRLRAARVRGALSVTNALADVRLARKVPAEMRACFGSRLVAVVAEFGCGKTQLAAQLTAASGDWPPRNPSPRREPRRGSDVGCSCQWGGDPRHTGREHGGVGRGGRFGGGARASSTSHFH